MQTAHSLHCLQVLQALQGGRRSLWNEAAQKLVILLSAPGASQGEHFLQVHPATAASLSYWTPGQPPVLRNVHVRQTCAPHLTWCCPRGVLT